MNELKWKTELAGAVTISSMNNSNTKPALGDVVQPKIGEKQKPYPRKDIADFVNVFLAKAKREVITQNHKQPLGGNLLDDNELPDDSKRSN